MYKLGKKTAHNPNSMKACQIIYRSMHNKQGSLTSETIQPTPAQIGSGYSAALMCMLHESLACVCEV